MDIVTLSKQNRLFWLGRYSQRVYTTVQYLAQTYDNLLDSGESEDYEDFCRRMGVPCVYTDEEDFFRRYTFDADAPGSVKSSIDAMLGNGMVLRETISTPTLSYLQMAHDALNRAAVSDAPGVELQLVQDYILAYRGSFDDSADDEVVRNITKTGWLVECVSLILRLNWRTEILERKLRTLLYRSSRTDLKPNPDALDVIVRRTDGENVSREELLNSAENLFIV